MSLRVLIVDDEELIASSLSAFLEDDGMEVATVGSAEQALELVRAGEGFQVCVMDMRLPGLDGNEAVRRLHVMSPALKFIIHTGSADYSLPDDLQALGVATTQLFRKPLVDMTPLAATVRRLAAGE